MEEIKKLHKVHLWMWDIDKKYPGWPDTESAWTEIITSADALARELELEAGCYERRLMSAFMHAKEKGER